MRQYLRVSKTVGFGTIICPALTPALEATTTSTTKTILY